MPTRDLSAFQEDDGLTYPGVKSRAHPEGATYTVASPDAATGLHLARLGELGFTAVSSPEEAAKAKLNDDEERDLYQLVLGETLTQMVADGVAWGMVRHIAQDAFFYWAVNEDFADVVLASQGEAVALANRADRRKAAKAAKKAPDKKASTTKRTARSTGGSKSSRASTRTPARTRQAQATTPATGPSSTSPSELEAVAATG